MSGYVPKDNSGSLFVNDKKERDSQPDRRGSARIDGVDYWVSGWVKKKEDGTPWMSLSYQRKDAAAPAPKKAETQAAMDDEIPF
jgi:hypothetical protein